MKLLRTLEDHLKKIPDFVSDNGELKKWVIINKAQNLDKDLIGLLLDNKELKSKFFLKVKNALVFNQSLFIQFLEQKNYLNDSYTAYKKKIGLNIDGKYLNQRNEVSLVWPYKDCTLEGGQSKEEDKREEIFFNETLAQDEITQLFEPKVLTNAKRYTAKGEKPLDKFSRDAELNRKRGLPEDTITDNLIIKGNNLLALHSLKEEFAGKVKLIYIDPPYNTGNDSFSYNDSFNHSTWLTFMKSRLEVAKELLCDSGSIYINIDFNEVHYLKVMLDEIFKDCFQREIIWRIGRVSGYKSGPKNKNYVRNHDTILFYTKDPKKFTFNKLYNSREDFQERFNNENKKLIFKKLSDLGISSEDCKEFIEFVSEVGLPEKYPIEDTWNCSIYDKLNSIAVVSFSGEKVSKMLNRNEIKGQKSEKLLQRIIEVSSNQGDIILDFNLGGGDNSCSISKIRNEI